MTPLWTSEALQQATNGMVKNPFDITGVSIDTRTLQPGDLFIALRAETDGHAHVQNALDKGAAGVMVDDLTGLPGTAPTLQVHDTLQALTALGKAGRARFTGKLVAVTGSVGKTTTKEMLRTALSAFAPTHAAAASYNNHWGVPLTLARLPAEAAYCIAEIGMNNPGEILPLARLAEPHVAIITTVGTAHIGHLGSREAIADEKASLLEALSPGGVGIIPTGPFEARLRLRAPASTSVLTFGDEGDISPLEMDERSDGTDIEAEIAGARVAFHLPAPGRHMGMNALAALAAIHALGLDPARAAAALADFRPIAGRGQQRRLPPGILLLDESYNASPAAVRAALHVLHLLPATRRLAVLGDMLELGAFARDEHEALAPDVAQAADLLYACGPSTRFLFDRVPQALQGAHTSDAEALAPLVAAAVRKGDAVLVKGSLGSRMRHVVCALEGTEAPARGGSG